MKKMIFIMVLALFVHNVLRSNTGDEKKPSDKTFLLDKALVIVDGPERRHIICQAELERVGIDGRKPTLDDLITEELGYQDALKHKIPLDDYADRYIRTIKKSHNITDKEVDRIFENAGLTPEEGRQKLQKMGANTTMIDLKVKARIVIPPHDVEEYNEKHPKYKQAKYQIEVAFVHFYSPDAEKRKMQGEYLTEQVENGTLDVMWGPAFWIREDDISSDKLFIAEMCLESISKPQRIENGFEFYRLKAKQERKRVPLERRYRRIIDILREPKFKEVFDGYVQDLYKTASIIYL